MTEGGLAGGLPVLRLLSAVSAVLPSGTQTPDNRLPSAHAHAHALAHAPPPSPHRARHTRCAHRESTATCPARPSVHPPLSAPSTSPHSCLHRPPRAMASLNTSTNGPNITRSYQNVINTPPPSAAQAASPTYGQWAVFAVAAPLVSAFQQDGGKESMLKVQSTGGTSSWCPAPNRPQHAPIASSTDPHRGRTARPDRRVLRRPHPIRLCQGQGPQLVLAQERPDCLGRPAPSSAPDSPLTTSAVR